MKNMIFNSLKMLSGIFTAAILIIALTNITASAQERTFANTNSIQINDLAVANPYPSNITVSGVPTSASRFKVTIKGYTHSYPDDVGVLLVAPDGKKVRIFTDCLADNGGDGVSNLNLTFDDFAQNPLPDNPTGTTPSGTYRTNEGTGDGFSDPHPAAFPSPAPNGQYANNLASLDGTNPNGNWQLYVDDDTDGNFGAISGGWEISFLPTGSPTATNAVISGRVVISSYGPITRLTLVDAGGNSTVVYAGSLNNGYYEFPPMPTGQTYTITAFAKGHTFSPNPRVVNLMEDTIINW